jgi:hypothetical protein
LTIAIGDGDIFDDENTKKLFQVPTAAINCQNHVDISTIKIKKFFKKCLLNYRLTRVTMIPKITRTGNP